MPPPQDLPRLCPRPMRVCACVCTCLCVCTFVCVYVCVCHVWMMRLRYNCARMIIICWRFVYVHFNAGAHPGVCALFVACLCELIRVVVGACSHTHSSHVRSRTYDIKDVEDDQAPPVAAKTTTTHGHRTVLIERGFSRSKQCTPHPFLNY